MSDDILVRVQDLRRAYGALVAVDGISFEVRRGEMFGLIGPDGAGKTTTLRSLLGLLEVGRLAPGVNPGARASGAHATSWLRPRTPEVGRPGGRIETCGLDPARQRRELSGHIGYLSQRFSLYGDLTVDENIAFFAEIHGVSGWRPRRDSLLDMVRMTPFRDRLADRLSGGMKQKLALACTLVHTPELLVLDEPTTGVDPVSRRDFWRLLGRLQREGLTILLTTPYLDEAERCTRVALMDGGRLLVTDAPGAIRESGGQVLEIVARPRREAAELLRRQAGVDEVEAFGERLHVVLAVPLDEPLKARLQEALRAGGMEVTLMRATLPSLEDVFIQRIRSVAGSAA